jgi:hypothetical protein
MDEKVAVAPDVVYGVGLAQPNYHITCQECGYTRAAPYKLELVAMADQMASRFTLLQSSCPMAHGRKDSWMRR